ncbi:hypothetical protein GIB67_035755 [Kingdonia uniflora]|uniref:SHSP domain-containing protein n=1 Tax=Kingdonia uniflora TaxID=39325 RepID=A0A7J7MJU5_9MAGN|nr:hypothetical protein GIB67_035755 [Kingdonia uniflora]
MIIDPSTEDPTSQSLNAPTRTYDRDAKVVASTPADVKEYPNSYIFIIDMPGLKSGDNKVTVEDENVLVISGERKRRKKGRNGVLTVTVEKLPPPEPFPLCQNGVLSKVLLGCVPHKNCGQHEVRESLGRHINVKGEIEINIDEAARGNPGKGGIGCIFRDSDGKVLGTLSKGLGLVTNYTAECKVIIQGVESAVSNGWLIGLGGIRLQVCSGGFQLKQYSLGLGS